jgi:hypothetical protein
MKKWKVVKFKNRENIPEILIWLENEFGHDYEMKVWKYSYKFKYDNVFVDTFAFKNEEDAVLFALIWK